MGYEVAASPFLSSSRDGEGDARGHAQGHEGEEGSGCRPQGDAPCHEGEEGSGRRPQGDAPCHEGQEGSGCRPQGDAQGHEGEEGRGRRPQGDAPGDEGQVSGDTDERGCGASLVGAPPLSSARASAWDVLSPGPRSADHQFLVDRIVCLKKKKKKKKKSTRVDTTA